MKSLQSTSKKRPKSNSKQKKSTSKQKPKPQSPQLQLLLYKNSQLKISRIQSSSVVESAKIKSCKTQKVNDRSKARSTSHFQFEMNQTDLIGKWIQKNNSFLEQQNGEDLFVKRGRSNYQFIHVIGKGGFGKVFKVKQKKSGKLYALKQMSKAMIISKKSIESVHNERNHLSLLRHPLIICMHYAFQDRQHLYLVMDLMQGGDLRYHINKKHKFTQQQARFIAACIFLALQNIHSKNILHRDIKPQNLVFDKNYYIHLADLGISKPYRPNNRIDKSGTPGYMAPQVMMRKDHGYQVDWYGLGVLLHQIMMGKRPYHGRERQQVLEEVMAKQAGIKKGQIPEGWSLQAVDFINKLLQRRPSLRLGYGGAQEIRNHPWLVAFPFDKLLDKSLISPFKGKLPQYKPNQSLIEPTRLNSSYAAVVKNNKLLLRNNQIQKLFEQYTWEEQKDREGQDLTTRSQITKKKEGQ